MALTEQQQALADAAAKARLNAYARYSEFTVGSAVLTTTGSIHTGCNVENASYGLTTCAERNAIAAAVAGGMQPGELAAIAVIGDKDPVLTPCGACRQVIAEFAAPDCQIICLGLSGTGQVYTLDELLPGPFGLRN